jgi:hypothetical protein
MIVLALTPGLDREMFSAASVFRRAGLALDEPFGPDWPSLAEDEARRVWREAEAFEPSGWAQTLDRVFAQWELKPASVVLEARGPTRVLSPDEATRADLSAAAPCFARQA